ncbi:MAG: hypothetical protein VW521_09110 [Rhodospirillales bacterium]|jgi:hypothetical protein
MNDILNAVNSATASLCNSYGVKFLSPCSPEPIDYDHDAALVAVKRKFLAGELDLQFQGTHYCFDDFVGVLFPESEEFQELCAAAARADKVDFDATFQYVVDKWVFYTVESMSLSELEEAME